MDTNNNNSTQKNNLPVSKDSKQTSGHHSAPQAAKGLPLKRRKNRNRLSGW